MILSCSTAAAEAEPERALTYFIINSINYSEPAPIDQMIHDLEGAPVDSGDFAFTHNQVELGLEKGRWMFAYFHRYDYFLEFNSDTAALAYIDRNDLPVPTNSSFDVNLRANHIRSEGIALGYRESFIDDRVKTSLRLNYLTSNDFTDGSLQGSLSTTSEGYQGDLFLDYQYSEDSLLERPEEKVDGSGFSIDFLVSWLIDEKWFVSLEGKDVTSEIRWNDVTYTQARATTDVISFDEEGRIDSIPVLSGIESYRDHTQRLPAQYRLIVQYQYQESLYIIPRLFSYESNYFYQLELKKQWEKLSLSANFDATTQSLGFSLQHKYVDFSIISDSTDYEKAKALNVQLGLRIPF